MPTASANTHHNGIPVTLHHLGQALVQLPGQWKVPVEPIWTRSGIVVPFPYDTADREYLLPVIGASSNCSASFESIPFPFLPVSVGFKGGPSNRGWQQLVFIY